MIKEPITNKLGMKFVYIPPGTFMMGSPEDERRRIKDEILHSVTLTKGFYIQTTVVTQVQWKAVMRSNPSKFVDCGDDCPVEMVTWKDVQEFIKKLNQKESTDLYRLPTEAEWEYACRAGSSTRYYFGDDERRLSEYAWYEKNSGRTTHPVGQLKPNAWGLYDMHGNVWEWCQDWYGRYPSDDVTDPVPVGSEFDDNKINRGGSWLSHDGGCRSAFRDHIRPKKRHDGLGLRLVRSAE